MLYNAHFFFCNNSAPSVTIAINSFTGNWTYEQDCLYLWKFVSWMFVNRRASVYCFVYCIILHYTHITLIFSNIPHVTLWYIFQSPARIVLFFFLSLFLHSFLPFQVQMLKKKVWTMRQVISTITQFSHFLSALTQKNHASSQKNSRLTALITMIWESIEERLRGWTTSVLIFGRSEGPPLHHHTQTGSGTHLVHCQIQTRNNKVDHSFPYVVKV